MALLSWQCRGFLCDIPWHRSCQYLLLNQANKTTGIWYSVRFHFGTAHAVHKNKQRATVPHWTELSWYFAGISNSGRNQQSCWTDLGRFSLSISGKTTIPWSCPFILCDTCGNIPTMNRLKRIRLVIVLAISLLLSTAWPNDTYQAKVVGISDSDTIKVLHDGKQVRTRLYGIDTPEKRQA